MSCPWTVLPWAPSHIHHGAGPPCLPPWTCCHCPAGACGGAPGPLSLAVRLAISRGFLGGPGALLWALLPTLRSPSRGPSGGPSGLDVHFSGVGSHRFCSLMPLGENGRYLLRELATSACLHPNGLFASLWKDLEEREDFSIQSQRLEWAPQWRGCEAPGPLVLGWSWCDNSGRGSWRVGWHQEELEDRQQTRPWVWPVQGGGPSWTDLLSLAVLRLCCQHLQPQAGLVSRHTCLHHHRVPRSSTQSAPERRRLHPLPLT